jgi:hypothetical protein
MSGRGFGAPAGSFGASQRHSWNNFVMRGVTRAIIGTVAAAPMIVALMIGYYRPNGEDSTTCLAVAAGLALLPVLAWRWFGGGRGILWGALLHVLSYGFWCGMMALIRVGIQLRDAARGGPVDQDDMLGTAIFGLVMLVVFGWLLKRIDPDL